jgi:hypothetical protein
VEPRAEERKNGAREGTEREAGKDLKSKRRESGRRQERRGGSGGTAVSRRALGAVERNRGAAGIDRLKTTELEAHLKAHWEKIRAKLLAGTNVPSPVKRVEIPKPSGGTRMLGIPTAKAGLGTRVLRRYGFLMPSDLAAITSR